MKHETAFDLGIITKNQKANWALKQYAEDRIAFHHKDMETLQDGDLVKAQGAIKELRRLLKLAEEVEQIIKDFKAPNG